MCDYEGRGDFLEGHVSLETCDDRRNRLRYVFIDRVFILLATSEEVV